MNPQKKIQSTKKCRVAFTKTPIYALQNTYLVVINLTK